MSQGDARSETPGGSGPPPRLQSWLESWIRALLELASVSPTRRAAVLASIVEGSQPTAIYYVLLGISELIACFALIIGSDATLIGANVVAPLMTPIFGVALGLARGDLRAAAHRADRGIRRSLRRRRAVLPARVASVRARAHAGAARADASHADRSDGGGARRARGRARDDRRARQPRAPGRRDRHRAESPRSPPSVCVSRSARIKARGAPSCSSSPTSSRSSAWRARCSCSPAS